MNEHGAANTIESHASDPHDPASIADSDRSPLRAPSRATGKDRLAAGAVAAGCLALLSVAAWLTPAAAGFGTHEQLGMLPCTWATVLGKPCPTCGMTTSFAYAANGDMLGAFTAQPFGALLALLAAMTFWGSLHVAITGSTVGRFAGLLLRPRVLWIAGALLLAAWGYKLVTWPGAPG